MSVLSHMKSMQKEMSAAEKKIYQFIRDNSEKASGPPTKLRKPLEQAHQRLFVFQKRWATIA